MNRTMLLTLTLSVVAVNSCLLNPPINALCFYGAIVA